MGLSDVLARLADRATHVLVVEVPGQWVARVELEQRMLRRGWSPAWTPADADVLAVCGVPGPELTELVDRLWEQMPGPRVRADITSPEGVVSALDDAADLLLDTAHHRADARERPREPAVSDDHRQHGGMGHEVLDQNGDEGHEGHGDMDPSEHGGHGGMDHSGMDHGDMNMAPGGIPLAEGGEDRDGLGMDVLHLPFGPVLPFWPAGLVLHCSLQGDVVVGAEVSLVDHDRRSGTPVTGPGSVPAAAVRCDNAMGLLALAGAEDAAARARRARDALLRGDQHTARGAADRLQRTVRKSRLLRWSLRSILTLREPDLAHHGLPEACRGDAYDRLLSMVERIRNGVNGEDPVSPDGGSVPWESVPHLITGLELGSVRLAVASLDLDPLPAAREVGHA